MPLLIVRLHQPATAEDSRQLLDWALLNDQWQRQQGALAVDLDSWEFVADEGVRLALIVPAQSLLHTAVTMLPKQRRHWQKALPFLVEEVVAEPIEEMHMVADQNLAIGDALPVVAVRHRCMREWLECCRRIGLQPSWIVSELSLIECDPDGLSLCLDQNALLLRAGDGTAMKTDAANLDNLLELIFAGEKQIATVRIITAGAGEASEPARLAALQAEIEGQGRSVTVTPGGTLFDYLSTVLCQRIKAGEPLCNLLQPPYQSAQRGRHSFNWRLLAYAAAICIALQLVLNLGAGIYLNSRGEQLQQQIVDRYRALFPQDRRIVDVRVQMQNHLNQTANSGTSNGFIALLGAIGYQIQAMNRGQDIELQQIRYDDSQGTLLLDMNVRQIQQLEHFKQALDEQGLTVTILSASEERQWVKGRLRIGGDV